MKDLVYQLFILGCQNINEALKNGLGGVIFFTKDIESEKQFKEQISEIKMKAKIPPFLAIDQEGGRVERTENIRPKRLSARAAYNNGEDFLREQSEEISQELFNYGINLNFAPCADVNTNPNNPIIGERAFSDNPDEVIRGINIFVDASRKHKIIPCVKHFPGHGDADKDSHLTLPVIDLPMKQMEDIHIKPFKSAISNNIEMIMVAHLHCTCFNKEVIPASLSKEVISYLRNTLIYDGVIITDDMVMKGVETFGSLEACIMAINAGVDMFIFRNSDAKTLEMIEKLYATAQNNTELMKKIIKSNERITKLKNKFKL